MNVPPIIKIILMNNTTAQFLHISPTHPQEMLAAEAGQKGTTNNNGATARATTTTTPMPPPTMVATKKAAAPIFVGAFVELHSLKAEKLNGLCGEVRKGPSCASGRWGVRVPGRDKLVAVKTENLRRV